MRELLKRWIHSAAGVVSIVLISISILFIFIAWSSHRMCFLSPTNISAINDILIGLATNLLGIVVTVSFVQYFLDRQNEEFERKEEIAKIKRYDKYMQTLISRYIHFYMALTTRITDRNDIDINAAFDHKFKFSDLADLYKPSLYISGGVLDPTIVVFFTAEIKLREYMLRMFENIDFKYNQELYDILMSFVIESEENDMRRPVLENMKVISGQKKMTDEVAAMISDETHEWLLLYQRGELTSNIMLPYVCLYYLIQNEMKLIKEYKNYMNNII